MLNPARSLSLNAESGRELPRIDAFDALYKKGIRPRHGEVIMIAGRSGTQKSGLALFWVAEMNLPTLYFSADMSAFTASSRLASMKTGDTTEMVEAGMAAGGKHRQGYIDALEGLNITFSFGSPISWRAVDEELEAYVELWDSYPEIIVFDNLMDFDGAESDYTEQMAVMSNATELARATGATVLLLHHASDKSWEAKSSPWSPPSRDQVKGGLSEKPELSLTVALDPTSMEYRIACVKQRMGPSDPTANSFATIRCHPEITRFSKLEAPAMKPAPTAAPATDASWSPSGAAAGAVRG
ncbi:DnaB-like replicative helicase [Streptomyces phage Celia]|uniref:DnaB-like dsDNA helicase n=1 Tax=Streptomyces phage Celia TaxID=2590946 RepID=A0A516KRC2_9CAUD|nr:DnaB-like replicative helicase [Streptomyces phage Celia]QDP44240.1 DnaB-like dsDNA helicase [Streptomyces phage Celia]QFG10500.1 DnaB-like dsDNA helicase [Streptomyces phage Urza]QJD50602.1 DnaB-like dsDNA helicase [Streptomyces phage Itza]